MNHGGEGKALGELSSGQLLVVVGKGLQHSLIPLICHDFKWRVVITVKDVTEAELKIEMRSWYNKRLYSYVKAAPHVFINKSS